MLCDLYVARRLSKAGKPYTCVVLRPEDESLSEFVLFDSMLCYRLAAAEGVAFDDYVVDETKTSTSED